MKHPEAKAARDAQSAALAKAIEECPVPVRLLGKTLVRFTDGKITEELGEVSGPAEAIVALRWLKIGAEL